MIYASLALNAVLIASFGIVWNLWRSAETGLKRANDTLDKCREIVRKLDEMGGVE